MTNPRDLSKFNLKSKDRILDVGGSSLQLTGVPVHTLVDILRPEEDPYQPNRLLAKNFVRLDITSDKFPFPDNFFDFCYCSHTLEDLIDTRNALSEISRVAKRGVIYTPSRGFDIVFSHYNSSDWNTGGRRVPGLAHHHWVFETLKGRLIITPKNYPLLYTDEFQFTNWAGPAENEYIWSGSINYEIFFSTSFHDLIKNYRRFTARHRGKLASGRALFWVDHPYYFLKESVKKILGRKGEFA